ncbi:hypothetical protein ACFOTA_11725 [Chitinophaga sp. GCM10012297]|uniref:Uncharacterized protein n=1 Tax=Chitinophaga chungangae TaxID=2821488 RepID=A0ABS3YDX7_9BACT|nr:hypothetical protein [Chitinophaga chungangae]MBO9152880.1 hypothetical protein [Chitinophaga chungangae]
MIYFSGPCKNEAGYKSLTGQSCEDAISLTGAYDFYSYAELCASSEKCVLIAADDFPRVTITIDYDNMRLQRTINYSAKTIRNDDFILTQHKTGKGTCIFVNQVLTADRQGFTLLSVSATGGTEALTFFNGHITWAKVGYFLVGHSLEKYRNRLAELGVEYMPIHLFIKAKNIPCKGGGEIACGYTYWTTPGNGFSWLGEFNTRKGSDNRKILFEYVKPKIEELEKKLEDRRRDFERAKGPEKEKMEKELKDRETSIRYLAANVDLLY